MSFMIAGTGSYLPPKIVTNEDFEKIVDTSDEWIVQRTGIKTRHFVSEGQGNVDMCLAAAREAMQMAGVTKEEIGGIIVGTCTHEVSCPSLAGSLQRALEIERCVSFDVSAACSGFLFALKTAERFMTESDKCFLVVGSEVLSRFLNLEDRGTCVLFGDGAGAAVLKPGSSVKYLQIFTMPDSNYTLHIGGANMEKDGQLVRAEVAMKGREVYAFATKEFDRVIKEGLKAAGIGSEQVDLFVLHQANLRIIETAAKKLRIPMEKVITNIQENGNISAACIPVALDQANREGRLKRGDIVVMAAVGGGLSSGCAVLEW